MFSGVDMVFTIPIFSSANPHLVLYVVLGLHIVLDIGMDVRIDGDGIDADISYVLSSHIFITIWTSYSLVKFFNQETLRTRHYLLGQ